MFVASGVVPGGLPAGVGPLLVEGDLSLSPMVSDSTVIYRM